MLTIILVLLIILFFLGYNPLLLPNMNLFVLAGRSIGLYDLLTFLVILWLIGMLPWPFRGIATVFLVLWILSFLGFIAIAGFSQLLMVALIIGLVVYLFRWAA
jgi:hypothetical protein